MDWVVSVLSARDWVVSVISARDWVVSVISANVWVASGVGDVGVPRWTGRRTGPVRGRSARSDRSHGVYRSGWQRRAVPPVTRVTCTASYRADSRAANVPLHFAGGPALFSAASDAMMTAGLD